MTGTSRSPAEPLTVRQYLAAGLIDELRLHVVPELLGAGDGVLDGAASVSLEPIAVSFGHRQRHAPELPRRPSG